MKKLKGFVIAEVMIALGVVSILGICAFHAYRDYAVRAHYEEIIQAANTLKETVTLCFRDLAKLDGCDGGVHHIPADIKTPQGSIASITVKNGVITVTPTNWENILITDNYVLTPKVDRNDLKWTTSGNGVKRGLAG
jgi:Tfp pilus assembly major pilin PilA